MSSISLRVLFVVLLVISTIITALRLYVRKRITERKWCLDDYLVVLAWICLFTTSSWYIWLVQFPIEDLGVATIDEIIEIRKASYCNYYVTLACLYLCKFAFLRLYKTIFWSSRFHRIAIVCTGVYLLVSFFGLFIPMLCLCGLNPLRPSDYYLPITTTNGPIWTCDSRIPEIHNTYTVMFVLFTLGDIALIAVPMSSLPRLNITLRQKIALSAVFGLGFFLIAVEIVRFRVIISAVTNIPHILVWNYVSAWTSVILASLPILRPLVFKRGYLSGGRDSMRIGSPHSRDSMRISRQIGGNYVLKEMVVNSSNHVETGVSGGSEGEMSKEVSAEVA